MVIGRVSHSAGEGFWWIVVSLHKEIRSGDVESHTLPSGLGLIMVLNILSLQIGSNIGSRGCCVQFECILFCQRICLFVCLFLNCAFKMKLDKWCKTSQGHKCISATGTEENRCFWVKYTWIPCIHRAVSSWEDLSICMVSREKYDVTNRYHPFVSNMVAKLLHILTASVQKPKALS